VRCRYCQARPLEEIQKSGTIVLATEGQYAPFNFFKGKQLTGYEVEVGEAVAKKMGLKFEWKTVGFDALLTGLAQDRWDLVVASHGVTEERAKAVTFTHPHYCSGGQIVSLTPPSPRSAT
jgi:polar amino acid transport system substrate-binding protein